MSNSLHSTNEQSKLRPCPDCGHLCSVSASSCPGCGFPFELAASTTRPELQFSSANGDQRSRSNRLAIFVALGLILVAVMGSILYILYARFKRETEVRGEVFIVTKGRQNIKLGLVEVTAIPEEKIRPFIENKLAAINLEYSKYESLEQGNSGQLENAQHAFEESRSEYDLLTDQLEKARAATQKAEQDASASLALAGYDSPQEVEAYQGALNKAATLKRRADELAIQLDTARSILDAKRASLSAVKSVSDEQLKKVIQMLGNEDLFKGVPLDGSTAVTNSDGQFSMKLRANRKYVIAAKAERRVFDSTEKYYWLIWVSPEESSPRIVMLTNNNLMGEESADSVFKRKEILPTGLTQH